MNKEQLRDKGGRLLGTIAIQSNGKHTGRDAGGRLRGTYDPKSNETRDCGGRLVARGDLLAVLITED